MKRTLVLLLLALPCPAFAQGLEEARALFLRAEREADPQAAVLLWEELRGVAPDGVGADAPRAMLDLHYVGALLRAAEKAGDAAAYRRAAREAVKLESPERRAWALILIARAQALRGDAAAAETLDAARKAADALPTGELRGRAAHGMTAAALAEGKNGAPALGTHGVALARGWLPKIAAQRQRADAMRRIARAEIALEEGAAFFASAPDAETEKLAAAAKKARGARRLSQALRYALAMPLASEAREKTLREISAAAMRADDYRVALDALAGSADRETLDERLEAFVRTLAEKKEPSLAWEAGSMIADGRKAARAWGVLAKYYRGENMTRRVAALHDAMWESVERMEDEARRKAAWGDLAKAYAETGAPKRARRALANAGDGPERNRAVAALIKTLAEKKKTEDAWTLLQEWRGGEPRDVAKASAALAKALAEEGDPDRAARLIQDAPGALGEEERMDKARLAIVKAYAEKGRAAQAEAALREIVSAKIAAEAKAILGYEARRGGDKGAAVEWFKGALADANGNAEALPAVLGWMARAAHWKEVKAWHAGLPKGALRDRVAAAVAKVLVDMRRPKTAALWAQAMRPGPLRDAAYARAAEKSARLQDVRAATAAAEKIEDTRRRVETLRAVAEIQAGFTDFYGILSATAAPPMAGRDAPMLSPLRMRQGKPSPGSVESFEKETSGIIASEPNVDPVVRTPIPSAVGKFIPQPTQLHRLGLNDAAVRAKIPPPGPTRIARVFYRNNPYNVKFVDAMGAAPFLRWQGAAAPDAIYLESGVADLAAVRDAMARDGKEEYLTQKGRVYTLRRPLIVGPRAALVISSADMRELRLSREAGAYLVNAGKLYIVGVRVVAWNEKAAAPAFATYAERRAFRPFIVAWSRSKSYFSSSAFVALGYAETKAYGISFTSGPSELLRHAARAVERPSATIVDNMFENMYYGFYSYEADNVALIGNVYDDNIVYGIDPHDRSRWFSIAYNTAYDTHKKHGIIISREVNDSTILGNVAYRNHGSGLMIDRQSSGTLIYANTAFANGQDGLTVFESNCKIVASNRFFGNARAGIKVRNSMDVGIFFNVLKENKQSGIHGYISNLAADPAHATRDFTLDPYSDVTAMNVVGNWIEGNGMGLNAEALAALYFRSNKFVRQSPKLMRGAWAAEFPAMLARRDAEDGGIFVTGRCLRATRKPMEACPFRDDGFFDGDGQKHLVSRLQPSCDAEKTTAAREAGR